VQNPATAQPSTTASIPFAQRVSVRSTFIVVFFSTLWLILWRQLSAEWSVNDQYSYGWFVPFFAIVLFWLRWEDRPEAESRTADRELRTGAAEDAPKAREDSLRLGGAYGSESGQRTNNKEPITNNSKARAIAIGITIVALLLLLPVRLFEIGNPDWRPLSWLHAIAVTTITLAFLWSIGGKPWLRHFAFPVLFTLVAVPWLSLLEEPIVQGLMRVVAAVASEVVALFGIPAQLEGNLIRIPGGLVGVNEACSGVRSLQTSLMIGLLFGELKRLSIWRRIVLVAVAAAIAFVGNCIRAFFLVWIAATQNLTAISRWHDLAGYAIVAAVFIGTLVAAALLGRTKKEVREQRSEISGQFRISNFEFRILAAALVWLALVEFAAAGWYRAHEHDLARTARWEIQWPQNAPNFHEIKIDDEERRILRFDRGRAAAWTLPAPTATDAASSAAKPLTCTLFFFRWDSGKNSALLASLHRPDVCLPAVGWNQTGDTGVKKYSVTSGLSLPFRHFEFRHGTGDESTQQDAHAFYCLWEDVVSPAAAKSQLPKMTTSASEWTRDERIRAVLEGRRHLGQQVMELVIQGRGALDQNEINARFESELPRLIKVEGQ
jgi:exosortase